MAVTVEEISVNGPKMTETSTGVTRIRVYSVQGLPQGTNIDVFGLARASVDPSTGLHVPRWGEPDRFISGTSCTNIEWDHYPKGSRTGVVAIVTFAPPGTGDPNDPGVKVKISGSNGQKVIKRWPATQAGKLGDPIIIGYAPDGNKFSAHITAQEAANAGSSKQNNRGAVYDLAEIPILSPGTVLEFEMVLSKSSLKLSQQYRRAVNSSPWQGGAAGTWFCRNVDSSSQAALTRWPTMMRFEYDPDALWNDHLEIFRDRDTNRIPTDIGANIGKDNNNGYVRFKPYAVKDFNALKLPNVQ